MLIIKIENGGYFPHTLQAPLDFSKSLTLVLDLNGGTCQVCLFEYLFLFNMSNLKQIHEWVQRFHNILFS